MAYVINPNGKDVWLRDNADTMDISPVTDASSVYLTNGRSVEQELSGTLKSEVVTVDSAMEKIVEGTLDGAYQECVLKGNTKWVDIDSGEILDEFIKGRNLELRGVESPSVTNLAESKPIMDGLICWLDGRDGKTGDTIWKDRSDNGNDVTLTLNGGYFTETTFVSTNNTTSQVLLDILDYDSDLTIEVNTAYMPMKGGSNKICKFHSDLNNFIIEFRYGSKTGVTTTANFFEIPLRNPMDLAWFGETQRFDTKKQSITLTKKDKEVKLFFDDTLKDVKTVDLTLPTRNNFTLLNEFEGEIASIKIYNRALTGEEIQHNYLYEQSIDRESSTPLIPAQRQNTLATPQDMTLHKVNNICDTYNAITGEYTQYIGERIYQVGDETSVNVITDMSKTLYVLDNSITTIVEPNIVPFAYENGYVSLDSASGILPTLEYATTISRMGQVTSNGLIIRKQEQQITNLEKMLIQGIVNMNYNNALLNLDLKL